MRERTREGEGHRPMHVAAHDRAEATRSALETHAVRLVGQSGLESTTVAAIAEAAGVTERTFFRYFASKHEAILGYVIERLTGALPAMIDDHCDDRVTIDCLLRAFRDRATELAGDDEFVRRMRIINSDPRLREELQVGRSRIREVLSVEIARYEGAKPDLRTEALARTTIAIVSAGADAWIEDRGSSGSVPDYIDVAARAVLGAGA